MRLQQLEYICEVVHQGLKVSSAAETMHNAQSGVSTQIRLLEEELKVKIFNRNGKRLVGITDVGRLILLKAEQILQDVKDIRRISAEFNSEHKGVMSIATTHTQARYALPDTIKAFTRRYPDVQLCIHQGNPKQIAEMAVSGEADLAIAAESITSFDELVVLPCYKWNRCVVAPHDHEIHQNSKMTLETLARFPIITYDSAYAGRSLINKAFKDQGLEPNVVLTAIDSDIIKTYVELGMGVGLLANMAFDPVRDRTLRAVDVSHLFDSNITFVGVRRGKYLRSFMYDFIELFASHLGRDVVDKAMLKNDRKLDLDDLMALTA